MALRKEAEIKEQIRLTLETLKRKEIISDVIVDDFKMPILQRDFTSFPVAILQTSGIQNETITNTQNFRTYSFDVVVLLKGDDVNDATTVEEVRASIMDEFDNNPTLSAVADGGVMPASSPIEPIPTMGGKSIIAFTVTLDCRAIKDLSFNG